MMGLLLTILTQQYLNETKELKQFVSQILVPKFLTILISIPRFFFTQLISKPYAKFL